MDLVDGAERKIEIVNTKRDFGENAVRNFYRNKGIPVHVQLATTTLERPAFAQQHNKHEADIIVIQRDRVYIW